MRDVQIMLNCDKCNHILGHLRMLAAIMNFLFRSEADVMVEELSQLGHLQLEFEKLPLTIVSHKKKILTAM